MDEELKKIKSLYGETKFNDGKFLEAAELFSNMSTSENFEEFLTLPAYKFI